MAWHQLNKTLTGGNDQVTTTRTACTQIIITNITANGQLLIGDLNISATLYAGSVAAAGAPYVIGPFDSAAPVNLADVYLRGTNGNVIHIGYVTP